MRVIIFILMGTVSAVLCGSVFGAVQIAGIVPDLLLLCIISVIYLENTAAGVVFGAVFGLVYDVMFSSVLGIHALGYVMVAAAFFAVFRGSSRVRPPLLVVSAFGASIVKELLLGMIMRLIGVEFNLMSVFLRQILPGALVCAALAYPIFWLIRIFYEKNWMRLPKSVSDDFL